MGWKWGEGNGGNRREERASHTAAAFGLAKPRAGFDRHTPHTHRQTEMTGVIL